MKKEVQVGISKKLIFKVTRELLLPIKNQECVTWLLPAGVNRRLMWYYFFVSQNYFEKWFSRQFKDTIFVFVDPGNLEKITNRNYLKLISQALVKEAKKHFTYKTKFKGDSFISLKSLIKEVIGKNFKINFILDDFEVTFKLDPSIYRNLEFLLATNKNKLSFLFISSQNLLDRQLLNRFLNLKYALVQNVKHFHLLSKTEAGKFVENLYSYAKKKFNPKISDYLYACCGGHPELLRYGSEILLKQTRRQKIPKRKLREDCFVIQPELQSVCDDLWVNLNKAEQQIIISVYQTQKLLEAESESIHYLLKTGLVVKQRSRYQIFGHIFEEYIKTKIPKKKLSFDLESKRIYWGENPCEYQFTFQEHKLLSYFLTHETQVVSRDEVAKILWGKYYHEKYSDYAIDKIISTLRKKLVSLGLSSKHLTTLKKRGFSFSQ